MKTLIVAVALLLAGCSQLYWTKPGANLSTFSADHEACVSGAARPVSAEDLREAWVRRGVTAPPIEDRHPVTISLGVYRDCLKARGWTRQTCGTSFTPPGLFRGLEDAGPFDEVPRQLPAQVKTAAQGAEWCSRR